jgi:hypothetical protein
MQKVVRPWGANRHQIEAGSVPVEGYTARIGGCGSVVDRQIIVSDHLHGKGTGARRTGHGLH